MASEVDAQDRAEQDIAVLSVILRIARAAAISRPDIQEAVRSEIYPAAIMVGEGLVEAQNQVRARGVGAVPVRGQCPIAPDLRVAVEVGQVDVERSEEHTSELQSLMRISYAVFCL